MKTFYQFLQEVYTPHPDHDKPDANLRAIISKLTHEQQVLFALHCAEDCYKLITDNELKELAYNCIQLIKQWLNSPDKPSDQKLRKAGNAADYASRTVAYAIVAYEPYATNAAVYAAYTASYASYVADATTYTANAAIYAAEAVTYAYGYDINTNDFNFNNIYNEKIAQYRQYALTIGSSYTPDTHNTNFNDIVKALKQGNFEKNGIEAFLDAVQESEYDDLLVHDQTQNLYYLAMLPYLKAKTTNELADLLYKNKYRFMLALKTIK